MTVEVSHAHFLLVCDPVMVVPGNRCIPCPSFNACGIKRAGSTIPLVELELHTYHSSNPLNWYQEQCCWVREVTV